MAEKAKGKSKEEWLKSKEKEQWSFEVPPPPIPQKDIKEVLNTDIVVVGFGIAGACAALSAIQAGAKVVLLEKGPTWNARGRGVCGIGTKQQKELGIEVNRDEVVADIMRWGGFRCEQRIINLWADNSGETIDWLLDLAEEAGIPTGHPNITAHMMATMMAKTTAYKGIKAFLLPGAMFQPKGLPTMMSMMENKIKQSGVDIRFETPAVQLIREGKGSITGVIAQSKDGYIQFNTRAVVLCTGGYEYDYEMQAKYAPNILLVRHCAYKTELTTGDGHKMALWVGAAMDEAPHLPLMWEGGRADLEGPTYVGCYLPRQPWLFVNRFGERYVDEGVVVNVWPLQANADLAQPGHMKWSIWDDKWQDEVVGFESGGCKRANDSFHGCYPSLVQEKIDNGAILVADTLEELVRRMGVPYETCMATIERYNELVRLGKDLDFGKDSKYLTAIEKPPFYACETGTTLLVTLGGLKINTKLQVLDTDSKAIPGLYAAGNTSGCFFFNNYPMNVPGLTHSRALTFGRLAGMNAAAERV